MNDPQSAETHLSGDRIINAIPLLWAVIFYLTIVVCLGAAVLREPTLTGVPLAVAAVLCGVSVVLFQRFYWTEPSWPMRPRIAWIYFSGQLIILASLLALSNAFIGFGFAIMGQTLGALHPRWWVLVLLPLFGLLAVPMGWIEAAIRADWLSLATVALMFGIWLLIAVLLTVLFGQRFQLLDLVTELRRAKLELEAAAAQAEELTVLRERTRFAREMHDSIGHALVAVNVKLEAAQRLYRVDATRADQELEATRELVRTTMGELRRSIADLRAPTVDHHDLPTALARLASEVSTRGGVAVTVTSVPDKLLPSPSIAETLFLIAREALINVERHASARQVTLALYHHSNAWCLEVADDGIGLRPSDLRKPGHFGILGMRERVDPLGGRIEVRARPEGGTLVAVQVPDAALVTV